MQPFEAEIQWLSPEKLTPYSKNAKVHTTDQIDEVAGLIAANGFTQPILVDRDFVIIAGHCRREASLRLGLAKVPVIVANHLDEYQVMALRIADNKVAEKATWDLNLLKFDVGTLALRDFDMKLTAMSKADLTGIMKEETADTLSVGGSNGTTPKERKDDWEVSEVRQIVLICDPPTFDAIMGSIGELMTKMDVQTNIEVIQKLIEFYQEEQDIETEAEVETHRLNHAEGG